MAQNSPIGNVTIFPWTPSITIGGSSTGITYNVQEGYYTKIGNVIYFNLHISLLSKGAQTGDIEIPTLPVTPGAKGALNRINMQFDSASPPGSYTQLAMLLNNSSPIVILTWFGANNAILIADNTTISDSTSIYATGFYLLN